MEYPIAPGQVAASGCSSGCKWLQVAAGSKRLRVAASCCSSGCKWLQVGAKKTPPACSMKAFTRKSFYTQTLLHRDAFTHRRFCTQKLLHTEAFTHKMFFYTQTLLHPDAFTHRSFCTQALLHTEAFTHRRFYTQPLSHTPTSTPQLRFVRPGCRGHQKIAILHQFLTLHRNRPEGLGTSWNSARAPLASAGKARRCPGTSPTPVSYF